jgi:hypothetical protein
VDDLEDDTTPDIDDVATSLPEDTDIKALPDDTENKDEE